MKGLRLLTITIIALSCLSLRAEQLTDSVRVHFRVNQTVIDTLLMGNDAAMRGFADRMQALSSKDSVNVTVNSILITGAASPEGSIAVNEHLSRERAAAITRWLQGYFEFPDTLPEFVFKGRDWQGLLMAVIGDPDVPNKKEVIDLLIDIMGRRLPASENSGIASTANKNRRSIDGVARLKAMRGGVPYRYLWRNHFPSLRASEVFITAEITPVVELDLLDQLDQSTESGQSDSIVAPDSLMTSTIEIQAHHDSEAEYGYVFAFKTDMLYDAALVPNLGVELPIGKHFSVGANWMYAWWKNHDRNRHWRIYGGDINARWYGGTASCGRLTGHHVGVYAQVLLFQVAFGGKGYITGVPGENIFGRPWWGGGLEYGYSKRIGKRLNIDFSFGIGYMTGEYNIYRHIDDCYVWQTTKREKWFGPTKAEISLVWLIGRMERRHPASEIQKGGAE